MMQEGFELVLHLLNPILWIALGMAALSIFRVISKKITRK